MLCQKTLHDRILGYEFKEILKYDFKNVEIHLENEILRGHVYTVDPVSRSIILVSPRIGQESLDSDKNTRNINIISHHSIRNITILNELNVEEINELNVLFDSKSSIIFTESEIDERKTHVEAFLQSRMIPVTYTGERNTTFSLFNGILIIEPPYEIENCQSTNLIVLKQVQKMMKDLKL